MIDHIEAPEECSQAFDKPFGGVVCTVLFYRYFFTFLKKHLKTVQ